MRNEEKQADRDQRDGQDDNVANEQHSATVCRGDDIEWRVAVLRDAHQKVSCSSIKAKTSVEVDAGMLG
jgi:hypothetical protein